MDIESELALSAADYKNAGNKLCSLHRYDEALGFYAKAIAKQPGVAIYHSNKALCHLKMQQFPQAVQECRQALELDPNLIKAHFFLGQALAESGNYDDALKYLQRAHELAKERQLNFGDDITYQIRLTKRLRWSKIDEENARLEDELHEYLVKLVRKDKEEAHNKQLDELQRSSGSRGASDLDAPQTSQLANQAKQDSPENGSDAPLKHVDESGSSTQAKDEPSKNVEAERSILNSKCDTYLERLELMFNDLKLQRKKREVPDHLCGKISFEIMHDPVITPSGITYDRQDIEEHLKRVGHFDPITRQPLTSEQLISNLAMKEVVDAYLSENEWANYY